MISLAKAAVTDVEGIGAVVQDVWKQDILPDVCRAQIEGIASALWVAKEEGNVVGFVSAFLTVDRNSRRRWEVDLLAVRRASQRQGLGERLIRQTCQDAVRQDVALARAAIRMDNVPGQRAFEKAGFSTDGEHHSLLLWSPQADDISAPCPDGVSLLPVGTLTYRGLWIEGLTDLPHAEQRSVVRMARARIAQEDRLNTGALIPACREELVTKDLRHGAKRQGEYYWFVKPISQT